MSCNTIRPRIIKSRFLFFIIFALLLVATNSCNGDGNWKDDGINPLIRKEIAVRNTQLVRALRERNLHDLKGLFSDSLLRFKKNIPEILNPAFIEAIRGHPFIAQNEFQVNDQPGSVILINSNPQSEWGYKIQLKSGAHENVVTLGYFQDSLQSFGMLVVWSKFSGVWKLNGLRFGPYKLLGQDAMHWYQKARDEFERDDNIDAFIHLGLARQVLPPLKPLFNIKTSTSWRNLNSGLKRIWNGV